MILWNKKSAMIIHIIWLTALIWTTAKCEPPINSYLPPGGTNTNSGGKPSPVYGPAEGSGSSPPGFGRPGASRSGIESNHFEPQDSYFPNSQSGFSNSLDTQYGPPDQNFNQGTRSSSATKQGGSSSQRGYEQGNNNSPSSQYDSPGQNNPPNQRQKLGQASFGNGAPKSSYGLPNKDQGFSRPPSSITNGQRQGDSGRSQRPNSSYGPPHTGAILPSDAPGTVRQGYQEMPSSSYESPVSFGTQGGVGNQQSPSGAPSSSYGTPEVGGSSSGRGFGRGSDFSGEESDEPAKYEFSYDVDDAQTGTNFHHSEQRDGDVATGEYNVVLPDGRKQVVEYEAGLQGYKPQIRYEGNGGSGRPGGPGPGLGSGGNQGTQGYPQGGPGIFGNGFQGQDNEIGYPRGSNSQEVRLGGFDRLEDSNQNLPQLVGGQDNMGYPRGGPNSGSKGQVFRGGSRRGQDNRGQFGRSGEGGNSGIETLNGESQGYPSGRPNGNPRGSNVGFSGSSGGNGGFSNGEPRDGFSGGHHGGSRTEPHDSKGFREGDTDGYPSGRPSGPRGSGY